MVPSGEIFHIQNIIKAGRFSVISKDIIGKINDFFVTFNQDKSIQQFFSIKVKRLNILSNGLAD